MLGGKMGKMRAIGAVMFVLCSSAAGTAAANSNIGVKGYLNLPDGAAAPPMSDPFNYQMTGKAPFFSNSPVPEPWEFAALGGSTNSLYYDRSNFQFNERLGITYSGSGWYDLSRSDFAGTNAIYQIDFQDDGTKDYGELFSVQDSAGHFIAIGVNNHVANGYYYLRTDQSKGNTGALIAAPRNGMGGNANWHSFKIYVIPYGSIATVDDTGSNTGFYRGLTSVQAIHLMGNWSKPVHSVYIDNLQVTPLTGAAPGTFLTATSDANVEPAEGGPGRIFNPYGDAELLHMKADDLASLFWTNNSYWLRDSANLSRYYTVATAVREADIGLCGNPARSKYDASGEWCSEFANYVLRNSDGVMDVTLRDFMTGISSVAELESIYQSYNCGWPTGPGFIPRNYITPTTPKPGDYLAMVSGSTGSRNGHSAIVVGVSSDARYIWTVEGNVDDCVHFGYRDFFVNGVLNPDLDGIGNSSVLAGWPQCGK